MRGVMSINFVARIVLLAVAYFVVGRIGLTMPYFQGKITLLWAPSGVALAAVMLGGPRYALGVFLGSFAISCTLGMELPFGFLIALTRSLSAVVGGVCLTRVFQFRFDFSRQRDLVVFLFVGVLGSSLISATLGSLILWAEGTINARMVTTAWSVWWLGDSMGVLLAAPPILAARGLGPARIGRKLARNLRAEIVLLFLTLIALTWIIFSDPFKFGSRDVVLSFLPLPVLIWIALRTGVLSASVANLILAGIAVWGTAMGHSPFARDDVHTGLLLLWIYLGTTTLMTLLVTTLQAERAAAEERVLRSKTELESIFRALPDLFFRMAADGTILDFRASNPADLYVAPEQFLNRRMPDLLPGELSRQISAAMRQALTSREVVEVEYQLSLPRGEQDFEARFVSLAAEGHEHLEEDQVLAVIRNITDRKRAVLDLKRSEARFRAFMANNPTIAFVKDSKSRYVFANRRWEMQFDPPRTDWLGKDDTAFWPPETAEIFQASDRVVRDSGQPYERVESAASSEGDIRHWFTFKFLLDESQQLVGGVVLDVSQAKRLEEQLRQAQKMEAVGQLAGGIAHDFNNLLTIINGYASIMLVGLNDSHPWQGHLKEINRAGERAADLTRQLLAFSRKQMLKPVRVHLNAVIEENAKMLRRLLGDHMELVVLPGRDVPVIEVDPSYLEQTIVNLAVNARDAMPQGGVLTLTTGLFTQDAADPAIAGVAPGRHALLRVADTGAGMDPAVRARIFEPFFTTKDIGKGTGLGLAMVYGFVQQSGGHIDVASEPGKGTTFEIYLPAAAEEAPMAAPAISPGALPKGTETILLVEDEDSVRDLTRTILTRCGYTVIEACNGEHALNLADSHVGPLDLLLTDVQMPHLNGRVLADQLKARRPEIKVLFMSGYADSKLRDASPDVMPLLEKPFTPSGLATRVREVLGKA